MRQLLLIGTLMVANLPSFAAETQKALPVVALKIGQVQVIARERITSIVSEDTAIVDVVQRSENFATLTARAAGETTVRMKWKEREESFLVRVGDTANNTPKTVTPANPITFERKEAGTEVSTKSEQGAVTKSPETTAAKSPDATSSGGITLQVAPREAVVTTSPLFVRAEAPALWIALRMTPVSGTTGTLEVTATFGNRGDGKATRVLVRDVLPAELEYVEGSAKPAAKYDEKMRELSWENTELAPASTVVSRQQSVSFRVKITTAARGKVSNLATIECAELESIVASNTALWSAQAPALLAVYALPDTILQKRNVKVPMLDVRGEEYQAVVDRLEALGVIGGRPGRLFGPDSNISRAESVKMVILGMDLKDTRDTSRLSFALGRESLVTVVIKNEAGTIVRTMLKSMKKSAGEHALTWEGRADNGNFVPGGKYRFEARAIDSEGTANTLSGMITVVPNVAQDYAAPSSFTDVKPADWFAGVVGEAEKRQYINGYPDHTFRARRPLSRAEATAIVVRALGLDADARRRIDEDAGFLDVADIPKWARGYVNVGATTAPKSGGELIIGYPGNTFLPNNSLRRKEAAAIINRLIDKETKRQAFVSGAVSPGVTVSIAGKPITGSADGRFREMVDLVPGEVTPIAVVSR